MKIQNESKSLDMRDAVTRAIELSPSNAALREAKKTVAELNNRRDEALAKLAGGPQERRIAAEILSGDDDTIDPRKLMKHVNDLESALLEQSRLVARIRERLAQEVDAALVPFRQPSVSRIAEALKVIQSAADDDAKLFERMASAGLDIRFLRSITFTPLVVDGWLEQRRAAGYQI
jgi:hypothetical protein